MPNGWVHAAIDLIAFGLPYFDLHQEKDKAHKPLGLKHRLVNHEWYQAFGKLWTFSDPFPYWLKESIQALRDAKGADRAEEQMASITHEYLDRVWDGFSLPERNYWQSFFIWMLFNPGILKNWTGVDVVNGRIHRIVDDQEIWEASPDTKSEYERLLRYVEVVKSNDEILADMLKRYG